jgi:uncharacterized protein (DUF1501 family)
MLNRRQFLTRTLQGSSLLALSSIVPEFVLNTARAAEAGKEKVLVILEMTGGNDGLNTVVPYGDDMYHKYRKTLAFKKEQVIRINDYLGLHPAMRGFDQLLKEGHLGVVVGVGYPNPNRSHFESMDIWQSGDPKRKMSDGWIGRSAPFLHSGANVPIVQIGQNQLPLACVGAPGGVVSINNKHPYRLELGKVDPAQRKARRKLLEGLAQTSDSDATDPLLQFVQRRQLQTYTTLDRMQEVLRDRNQPGGRFPFNNLSQKMQLVSRLIQKGFGTRVFYVSIDGFDTHSGQAEQHRRLLQEVADSVHQLFNELKPGGHDKRVLVMTFSEFGRRVQENGSRGTDHGSGSCLFVAGPAVKGGPIGKHPSLKSEDLDYEATLLDPQSGDLRYNLDFRQVYATLLDKWLGVDSKGVLANEFKPIELLRT